MNIWFKDVEFFFFVSLFFDLVLVWISCSVGCFCESEKVYQKSGGGKFLAPHRKYNFYITALLQHLLWMCVFLCKETVESSE